VGATFSRYKQKKLLLNNHYGFLSSTKRPRDIRIWSYQNPLIGQLPITEKSVSMEGIRNWTLSEVRGTVAQKWRCLLLSERHPGHTSVAVHDDIIHSRNDNLSGLRPSGAQMAAWRLCDCPTWGVSDQWVRDSILTVTYLADPSVRWNFWQIIVKSESAMGLLTSAISDP
jgi:hypothetical protein